MMTGHAGGRQTVAQVPPAVSPPGDPLVWLEHATRQGAHRSEALAFFDCLAPVSPETLAGQWRGAGLHTAHPLDGLLEAHNWYGKAFDLNGDAHPLLFRQGSAIVPVDPRWIPMGALKSNMLSRSALARVGFSAARTLLRTRRPQARLRLITYRGVTSGAMIYDRLPIIDLFRQVTPNVLLGLMDRRDEPPFFFTLHRQAESVGLPSGQ